MHTVDSFAEERGSPFACGWRKDQLCGTCMPRKAVRSAARRAICSAVESLLGAADHGLNPLCVGKQRGGGWGGDLLAGLCPSLAKEGLQAGAGCCEVTGGEGRAGRADFAREAVAWSDALDGSVEGRQLLRGAVDRDGERPAHGAVGVVGIARGAAHGGGTDRETRA